MARRIKQAETGNDSTRQRIATALIYERLGIEGDWHDPEFEIGLPTSLPANKGRRLSAPDVREIESGLGRLVTAGCNKVALYWCLAQLGSEAEGARQGKRLTVQLNEDESRSRVITSDPAMATRQDMAALINKVSAAAKAIRRYREELLLVAEACKEAIELPGGKLIEPELPEASMMVLLSSLGWVKKLASAWESPNPKALMKGKGLLFLLLYVWLCTAHESVDVSPKKRRRAGRKQTAEYRLCNQLSQELAELVHVYHGVSYTAADLNDKLQDFAANEPRVLNELLALMKAVDGAARTIRSYT